MALSQVQCLDDNHVNPRTHESKPEFLYCEDQRLALEAFMRDGREAFGKYLCARGLRGFLSDPELETLAEVVEPYDPGAELFFPENAEEGEPPLSLHYWPELSDTSVPQMDLSWPENVSYRGVTRTTVYAQPPLEGQVHIKEVVRKMIAQAQKVIAVVMDVFTDVDIFRDLLDAGFKRKVSVYILLERTTLPHFQSMCQRANMHGGHLKNLRVRCTDGVDFYSRSCTKVGGRMGHRFMFIDGDKAVSGSYSFTWMSSRLDKNLITVVTGQAVEAFDRLFRILYATSSSVDLRQVTTEPEPELEPVPLPVPVAAISADMARKLNSPKYAMVALSSPVPAAGLKETQDAEKKGRQVASKEPVQDPPLHPGLVLEKVCMMAYLPTWPEPDPPSDVIGFINVRDTRKPNQVHLQRSEMFETSQAIRFSSPFSMPKETLPDVAKPRQVAGKHEETNKLQPAREEAKAEESVVDGAQPTQRNAVPAEATGQKPPASGPKCESDTATTLGTENKQHSKNTPADQDARTPRQPSSQARPPDAGSPSQSTRPLPGSNVKREAGSHLNAECDVSYRTHAPQEPDLRPPTDSDTQPHAQAKAVPPPSTPSPTINNTSSPTSTSVSSSSLSENSHVSATASRTIIASSPLSSSSIPPLTSSSSTTPNPPLPSSTPPVPKPRTVQLVMKGGAAGEGQEPPEFSIVRKLETSTGVRNEPAVTAAARTSPENVPETVPEPQSDSGGKTGAREAPQREQSGTSRETKTEAADGRRESAATQSAAGNKAKSDVLITDAPKAESVNIQEIIPTDVEPKTLMSTDCKLTPQIERVAAVRTETKAPERHPTGCESSAVPNENRESVSECKTYLARAHAAQRISYSELSPKDAHVLETVDSLKAPVFSTHSADAQGSQGNQSFTPNTATHNAHGTFQEQTPQAQASTHTTERPQRLHLFDSHVPDFRSPMPERDSRSLLALVRTPTPEGFLPHTPDSRTHTPDSRTSTSDEYMSPRTDSALSTNSEEFYECSDYSSLEPVFDRASFRNHEDYVSFTHANTVENGREDDGRGSVADHLKQGKHSTATEEENQEALASKRKRVLNQSVDAGATPGELTNERTGPMPSSTGDLQPRKSSSERNRPDKEMAVDRGALGPSGAERRDTDRQKLFHSLPKTPRGQQRDREASSSPSRPSRPPPRPLSTGQAAGPRPWGSRQPSQAESKMFHGGFQNADYTSSPRRPPSRPPPPGTAGAVWPAGGRKQDDVARGHQSLFSRQPPQGKTRAGPLQNQYPFPKAEASQSQTASPQEAHWQDEGKNPFSLTVSRLYKVSKLPAQSKGGSASSTGQGRKSTS